VETSLQYLKEDPAFASKESRLDLLGRVKDLPGQPITTVKSTGWPSFALQALSEESIWEGFTAIRFVRESANGCAISQDLLLTA
jgi:hypothetical protein